MSHKLRDGHVDILLEQLKTLSREDRILLGLFFYEQLEVEEIAIVLGQPVTLISKRLDLIESQVVLSETPVAAAETVFSEFFG